VLLGAGALAIPAAAGAAEATLGSTLAAAQEATYGGVPQITVTQSAAPSEQLTVPSAGTINSWSVRSGENGAEYELRVMRPAAEGKFTAAGTSGPLKVTDAEDKIRTAKTSLPVKKGDHIGLYVVKGGGAPISNAASAEDELRYIVDPFVDGVTTKTPEGSVAGHQELLLQATVEAGAPVSLTLPVITGESKVGSTLNATEGTWENATSFAFQWLRCNGELCSPILGATSSSYVPTVFDEGQQLRVEVIASGGAGHGVAYSERTAGVKAGPPPPPLSTAPPAVSGEARETETLTATTGSWAGSPTSFAYEWLRCASAAGGECAPVAGATSSSYTLVKADVGFTMRVRVTATNGVGPTAAESAPTAIVQPLVIRARLAVTPNPSCTGVPTLLDASGTKSPNGPITYRFTYVEFPIYEFLKFALLGEKEEEAFLAALPPHLIYEGPSSTASITFGWDRPVEYDPRGKDLVKEGFARDQVVITVTATDLAGAKSSEFNFLLFNQTYSVESRAKCPRTPFLELTNKLVFAAQRAASTSVSGNSVLTAVHCLAPGSCAGSLTIVSTKARIARSRRVSKPVTIAALPFFSVKAHRTATIRAKLTKQGRALLRGGKAVPAVVRLTGVGITGATSTRSFHVTLRRR
jgi:hypothetical protein